MKATQEQEDRAKRRALHGLTLFLINAPGVTDAVLLYAMVDLLKTTRQIEFKKETIDLLVKAKEQAGC